MDAPKLRLGDTEVPRIGLGTNRLTNTSEHVALVKEAVAAGLGHIDTAHTYTGGESEETIGAALSPVADGVVVATKGGWGAGNGRPEVLRAQIEESLRRLRTETIARGWLPKIDPSMRATRIRRPVAVSIPAMRSTMKRCRARRGSSSRCCTSCHPFTCGMFTPARGA